MNLQFKAEILISLSSHDVLFAFKLHPVQFSTSQGHLILSVWWSVLFHAHNYIIFAFHNPVLGSRFLMNALSRIHPKTCSWESNISLSNISPSLELFFFFTTYSCGASHRLYASHSFLPYYDVFLYCSSLSAF